jgi:hypothetical protein
MPSSTFVRLAATVGVAVALAGSPSQAASDRADRVLLISIAGMHDFDLDHFVAAHPDSALAKLAGRGVLYTKAMAPRP